MPTDSCLEVYSVLWTHNEYGQIGLSQILYSLYYTSKFENHFSKGILQWNVLAYLCINITQISFHQFFQRILLNMFKHTSTQQEMPKITVLTLV